MTITGKRNVTVKQLPERLRLRQERAILRELGCCLKADRPRLVLDCSRVHEFDRSVIHLLLRCLEEAMKHNGDVKLASVPPSAARLMELTGANRVFDIFATTVEAVNSFHDVHAGAVAQASFSEPPCYEEESAA